MASKWTGNNTLPEGFNEKHAWEYFKRIRMPVDFDNILDHHLTTIPFGNLSMFYYHQMDQPDPELMGPTDEQDPLSTRGASVHAIDSFHKLVTRHRDGTCGENNSLLSGIMLVLGYDFFATLSRFVFTSKKKAGYSIAPLNHLVIIVKLNGRRYLVDSGYALIDSFAPVPIIEPGEREGDLAPVKLPGNKELRVVYRNLDGKQNSNLPFPPQLLLEARIRGKWRPQYAFTMNPFLATDAWILTENLILGVNRITHHLILRIRSIDPPGSLTVFDNLMVFQGDDGEDETTFLEDEAHRRKVFKEKFGVHLHPKDVERLPPSMLPDPQAEPNRLSSKL
ncbi:hypothetical protein L0F63_006217 [Massospora cicadina]|nr:hypothetical protein L0F63_006217 [Massospora cicadina]